MIPGVPQGLLGNAVAFAIAGIPATAYPPPHVISDAARPLLVQPWEFEIWDDLQQHPEQDQHSAGLGYRSALNMPIRLEGQMVGLLAFLSRTPAPDAPPSERKLANPFSLRRAILFAAIYATVRLVVRAAQELLGSTGMFVAAGLASLADVDALTTLLTVDRDPTGTWAHNVGLLPELFKKIKAAGLTISLDTNDDPDDRWGGSLMEALQYVDVFLPNEREAMRVACGPLPFAMEISLC